MEHVNATIRHIIFRFFLRQNFYFFTARSTRVTDGLVASENNFRDILKTTRRSFSQTYDIK